MNLFMQIHLFISLSFSSFNHENYYPQSFIESEAEKKIIAAIKETFLLSTLMGNLKDTLKCML